MSRSTLSVVLFPFLRWLWVTVACLSRSFLGQRRGRMRTAMGKGSWRDWKGREATGDGDNPRWSVWSCNLLIPNPHTFLSGLCPLGKAVCAIFPRGSRGQETCLWEHTFVSGRAPGSPFHTRPKPLPTAEAEWWYQVPLIIQWRDGRCLHSNAHYCRHWPWSPLSLAKRIWLQKTS